MPELAKVQKQVQGNQLVASKKCDCAASADRSMNGLMPKQQMHGNQAIRHLLKSRAVQAKLKIGKPDDEYEREADWIAEQLMRIPETTIRRQVELEEDEKEKILTKPRIHPPNDKYEQEVDHLAGDITGAVHAGFASENHQQSSRSKSYADKEWRDVRQICSDKPASPRVDGYFQDALNTEEGLGRPLPLAARAFFEPSFGSSFEHVRIHDGPRADALCQEISARAFTHSRHIYFANGQYDPHSTQGRRLIAHELIHTIQQSIPEQSVKNVQIRALSHAHRSELLSRWENVTTGDQLESYTDREGAWSRIARLQRRNPDLQYRFVRRRIQHNNNFINVFVVQSRPRPQVCGRDSTQVWGSYINRIDIDLGNLSSGLAIGWDTETPLTHLLPRSFRISPGAGLCSTWCDNRRASRAPDLACTPKGSFQVDGKSSVSPRCQLRHHPGAHNATYFATRIRNGVAIHKGELPDYPASHGCVRTTRQGSAIVYDNSRISSTAIVVSGTWNGNRCYQNIDDITPRVRRGRERGPEILQ